jgi:hypothetical protein
MYWFAVQNISVYRILEDGGVPLKHVDVIGHFILTYVGCANVGFINDKLFTIWAGIAQLV